MGKHRTQQVALIPIASPLAGHRLTKKIGSLIEKSCEAKKLVYGVKDTKKAIKKHEKGLCILGGNVTPMDIITHIPSACENNDMPYVFLTSKEKISGFAQRTSPVACVVVKESPEYKEEFDAVVAEINALNAPAEAAEE